MASNCRHEVISEEKRADLKAKRLGTKNANSASASSSLAASALAAAVALIKPSVTVSKRQSDLEKEGFRPFEITGDDGWKDADGYSDDERLVEDEILVDVGSYEVDEEVEEFEDENGQ
ncbi:hypothetical protein IFR05_012911 [Cadophora sp. M221]|nr:hypothetical protein IFR05_012911 [Cadophora sp. M221]